MTVPALHTLFQLPTSYAERLALKNEIRINATLEEYLEFADSCEYKVEYSNGQIVSMGQPTDTHELVCGNVITAFNLSLIEEENFRIYGSNLGIFIPEAQAHYKPDATILNAAPEFITHKVGKRNMKSVKNPFAVVEVFSKGTMAYDITEKLVNYKRCPYLKYIIYIYQKKPYVTIFQRNGNPDGWLNNDYVGLEAKFEFEGKEILLSSLYRKVIFPKAKSKK